MNKSKNKSKLTYTDIQWLKSEFLPNLADAVVDKLSKKLNNMTTKLDYNAGELKTIREEQITHSHSHARVDRRLNRLERKSKHSPHID